MTRTDLRLKIGLKYLTTNTENEEFSYPLAFKQRKHQLPTLPKKLQQKFQDHVLKFLDLRFENQDLVILIETKTNLKTNDIYQLEGYKYYETILNPHKNIISILHDLTTNKAVTYKNGNLIKLDHILSFEAYLDLFNNQVNDRSKITEAVSIISNQLEGFIQPFQKALFVGLCLIAINYAYHNLSTTSLLKKENEQVVLNSFNNKDDLIAVLQNIIKAKCMQSGLSNEVIANLLNLFTLHDINLFPLTNFINLLQDIITHIIPFVVLNTYEGEDLLDVFFITFNKYSTRKDKNQTFTPPHIASFMSKLLCLDENSKVLDPTCGSGTLLMQSEIQMLKDVYDVNIRNQIKSNNIIGIEYEQQAYNLALINFLLHNDTKITLIHDSCFNQKELISQKQINRVIMNPPFNAFNLPMSYANSTKLIDHSKGLVFFNYATSLCVGGYACCILPYACLGSIANKPNSDVIKKYRTELLAKHTLKAVITLSSNVFFPSVNYDTCIVLLELNKKHNFAFDEVVFLDGRQDGFICKENSRIDVNNTWPEIEAQWLDVIFKKQKIKNISSVNLINKTDTWLPLNYLTSNKVLTQDDFNTVCANYLFYAKNHQNTNDHKNIVDYYHLNTPFIFTLYDPNHLTKAFKLDDLFTFKTSKVSNSLALQPGTDIDYIAAKKDENGVKMHCARTSEKLVSPGNCISFICAGAGSNGYQNYFYYETLQTSSNILGYSKNCKLNMQIGLYLVTILNNDSWRWNYGRKRKDELKDTIVYLPITVTGDIDYVYISNVINTSFELVIKQQAEELSQLQKTKDWLVYKKE